MTLPLVPGGPEPSKNGFSKRMPLTVMDRSADVVITNLPLNEEDVGITGRESGSSDERGVGPPTPNGAKIAELESLLGWLILLTVVAVTRVLWPDMWRSKPAWQLPAPRPMLPEGLPRGSDGAKRVPLEDAQPGDYVAFVARVVEPAELIAPVTKRPCVAYDVVVASAVNGQRVARVLRAGTFAVDTGKARATVDARGAFVRVEHDHHRTRLDRRDFDEGTIPAAVPAIQFEAYEGVIAPGQYVLVIGMVERPGVGDTMFRDSADVGVRIGGGGVRPSVVSSVPADLHSFDR